MVTADSASWHCSIDDSLDPRAGGRGEGGGGGLMGIAMENSHGEQRVADLMRPLFVSATSTVPLGPADSPPGSESRLTAPLPSAKPALPLPATVLMRSVTGSSTCAHQENRNAIHTRQSCMWEESGPSLRVRFLRRLSGLLQIVPSYQLRIGLAYSCDNS